LAKIKHFGELKTRFSTKYFLKGKFMQKVIFIFPIKLTMFYISPDTNLRGRLNTVDLLIRVARFVRKKALVVLA